MTNFKVLRPDKKATIKKPSVLTMPELMHTQDERILNRERVLIIDFDSDGWAKFRVSNVY